MPHESLLTEEDLLMEETGKNTEEMMDPFDLAHHQIHTIVNKHAPNQHYPTYEEDAAHNLAIERSRRSLVREALRSPFIMRKIANIQKQVYAQLQQKSGEKGEDPGLSFNRHIRVSETEGIIEKSANQGEFTAEAIEERMGTVIPKLLHLIACDEADRKEFLRGDISATERALLKKMIAGRARIMIDLSYSIPVRMDKVLTPLLKLFQEKSDRIKAIQKTLTLLQKNHEQNAQDIAHTQKELDTLYEELLQTPQQIGKTQTRINRAYEEYKKALHALTEPHLRLVLHNAKRYPGTDWDRREFESAGFAGIMRAAELFEHRMGCKFNTYATYWIHQEIHRTQINMRKIIQAPEYLLNKLHIQTQRFYEEYHRLPLDKADDIAILSEWSDVSEDTVRSLLALQHTISLNLPSRSRQNGEECGSEIGDFVPDEKQPSPLTLSIEREMEDYVHEVLRGTPLFHRIMFKLRRGLRLRDYELPGTTKIFPERSLVRILIKLRNGFPLTETETLIFHECNNTSDKRKAGLPSPLGPAEQLEDPPEGYLGSLIVEASKANKKGEEPAIIETVPIFDHAEKNSDKEAGYTLEIVATVCGVTRERVRQLEKILMKKLQDPVRLPHLKALFTHG